MSEHCLELKKKIKEVEKRNNISQPEDYYKHLNSRNSVAYLFTAYEKNQIRGEYGDFEKGFWLKYLKIPKPHSREYLINSIQKEMDSKETFEQKMECLTQENLHKKRLWHLAINVFGEKNLRSNIQSGNFSKPNFFLCKLLNLEKQREEYINNRIPSRSKSFEDLCERFIRPKIASIEKNENGSITLGKSVLPRKLFGGLPGDVNKFGKTWNHVLEYFGYPTTFYVTYSGIFVRSSSEQILFNILFAINQSECDDLEFKYEMKYKDLGFTEENISNCITDGLIKYKDKTFLIELWNFDDDKYDIEKFDRKKNYLEKRKLKENAHSIHPEYQYIYLEARYFVGETNSIEYVLRELSSALGISFNDSLIKNKLKELYKNDTKKPLHYNRHRFVTDIKDNFLTDDGYIDTSKISRAQYAYIHNNFGGIGAFEEEFLDKKHEYHKGGRTKHSSEKGIKKLKVTLKDKFNRKRLLYVKHVLSQISDGKYSRKLFDYVYDELNKTKKLKGGGAYPWLKWGDNSSGAENINNCITAYCEELDMKCPEFIDETPSFVQIFELSIIKDENGKLVHQIVDNNMEKRKMRINDVVSLSADGKISRSSFKFFYDNLSEQDKGTSKCVSAYPWNHWGDKSASDNNVEMCIKHFCNELGIECPDIIHHDNNKHLNKYTVTIQLDENGKYIHQIIDNNAEKRKKRINDVVSLSADGKISRSSFKFFYDNLSEQDKGTSKCVSAYPWNHWGDKSASDNNVEMCIKHFCNELGIECPDIIHHDNNKHLNKYTVTIQLDENGKYIHQIIDIGHRDKMLNVINLLNLIGGKHIYIKTINYARDNKLITKHGCLQKNFNQQDIFDAEKYATENDIPISKGIEYKNNFKGNKAKFNELRITYRDGKIYSEIIKKI